MMQIVCTVTVRQSSMRLFCKLMSVSEVRNIKLSRCCIVDPDFGQAKPPELDT
jgi:hypothetical protein